MSTLVEPLPGTARDPLYPDSDGAPMGETEYHVKAIIWLLETLEAYFPDAYVAADMFLYYQRGNPAAKKAPDVMLIKGVGKHERRSFRTWEEKAVPCVIFEITSEESREVDAVEKPAVYARLGVKEYFLFDPERAYLYPPFQGFRLEGRKYRTLKADRDGSLESEELGLKLHAEGMMVRLTDRKTGERLLTSKERADAERERADAERERAQAERRRAKTAAKRANAAENRAEAEQKRAEAERKRAEAAAKRAEADRQRLAALEEENARLRTALNQQKKPDGPA